MKMFAINVGAAACCALLAAAWSAVAFAAGESGGPVSLGATLTLSAMVLAVVALGMALSAMRKRFPWVAAILTPVFSGLIMAVPLDRDGFAVGLRMGCLAAAVFLAGAAGARGAAAWRQTRKSARELRSTEF